MVQVSVQVWVRIYAGCLACLIALVGGGLVGGLSPQARAHDAVISATPGMGATVTEFPRELVLEFSGIPLPQFNTVALSNADTGEILFRDESPQLEQQFVRVPVPADLDPETGHYVIGFQITSSDGHATRGRTTFTYEKSEDSLESNSAPSSDHPPAAPHNQQNDLAAENNRAQRSGTPVILVTVTALAIGLGVVVIVFLRRWRKQ